MLGAKLGGGLNRHSGRFMRSEPESASLPLRVFSQAIALAPMNRLGGSVYGLVRK